MSDQTQLGSGVDLRQYWAILRTRKWTIIACVVLGAIVALMLSARQTPQYEGEATMLVEPDPATGIPLNAENESAVIMSAPVASLVIEDLDIEMTDEELLAGGDARQVSPTSEVIAIQYTSTDPEFARDVANSFARNYIEFRRQEALASLEAERRGLEDRISRVRSSLERTNELLEIARRQGNDGEVIDLSTESDALTARLGVLIQRLDDLAPVPAGGVGFGRILQPASLPTSPSSPDHPRNGALGLLAGLFFGIGGAFLLERLDDRFRGRPDVERAIESPVLATVPRFTARGKQIPLPTLTDPKGPASEAYRNLRTGLQFITSQRDMRSILVTSPSAHEGKTSTAANVGVALSQAGRRVVLLSADLRRPSLENVFGAQSPVGLSTWLLGDATSPAEIMLEHPEIPNLSLLPSGPVPSNPAELLTSPNLAALLAALEGSFDFVVIDSPPVLPVADAVILASRADATLLVIDASSTRRSAAVHAKEQIERVGGSLIGCVLNAFDPSTTPYYYEPYYYSAYYGQAEEDVAAPSQDGEVLQLHEEATRVRRS